METVPGYLGPLHRHRIVNCGRVLRVEKSEMSDRHLLIPVDLYDPDLTTIDAALGLAVQNRARTTLLHVSESIDDDDDKLDQFYTELEVSVRGQLVEFEQLGVPVRSEIFVGRRARDIVQPSATESVDLIVMRSRQVDLNQPEYAMTSVSHQVSMFCQCAVRLVK